MNHKTFVLIGGGLLQLPLGNAATNSGYRIVVVDGNPECPGADAADTFYHCDISDPAAVVEVLRNHSEKPALCATSGTDFSDTVAAVNAHYSLPGILPGQAELLTDKLKMREHFQRHSLPQPAFISGGADLDPFFRDHPSPHGYVIKPVRNMGARGVLRIEHRQQLSYAREYAARYDKAGRTILEHFIPAHELSVDALVYKGRVTLTGVADRIIEIKDNHYFIENGHSMPSALPADIHRELLTLMQKTADSLSATNPYTGALKGDIRYTDNGQLIIGEIAGRLSGGFMSTHTYPEATGIDLMRLFIELLEGKEPNLPESSRQYRRVSIERSFTPEPGVLESLVIPPPPAKEVYRHVSGKAGDLMEPVRSNVGKLAHFVFSADTLTAAENSWTDFFSRIEYKTTLPKIPEKELAALARNRFNKEACRVCKVCDGKNCASGIPGMGGAGSMSSFRDNLESLSQFKILPRFLIGDKTSQTNTPRRNLFGHSPALPILIAPITGGATNMAGSITEWEYAMAVVSAAEKTGSLALLGEGAAPDKFQTALSALKIKPNGFPVFKPRSDDAAIEERMEAVRDSNISAWGMDIDAVGIATMNRRNLATQRKSAAQLSRYAELSGRPFFLKGILTIEDAALAADAGAGAIIVSNHGGRIFDGAPGAARVLQTIATYMSTHHPQVRILADGGIRSGADVFRMLALGAEFVLVGRPIAIAAVAAEEAGIISLLRQYHGELTHIMAVNGLTHYSEIRKDMLLQT